MRTAAIVRCYHLTKWLPAVLRNLSKVDHVLVANSRFFKTDECDDDTLKVVNNLGLKNVQVIKIDNKAQHEVFNDCVGMLQGYDYIFINDADELMTLNDRDKVLKYMQAGNCDAAFCGIRDYTPQLDSFYQKRGHKPCICIKPNVHFYDTRCLNYGSGVNIDTITLHHLGYAYTENDIQWKRNGLWYKGETEEMDKIRATTVTPCQFPDELLEIL